MRILHINCNYLGTTLHQLMVEKLDAIGFDNSVYVPTYDKRTTVIEVNSNVIVSECFKRWDRLIFDYKQLKIYNDVSSKIDVASFDCIHAYTLFSDGNCARKLSVKYGVPYVVAVRNTDVNEFFKKMIHLRGRGISIMREAKAVFFLSESYRQQVIEKYVPTKYRNVLMKKSFVVPNGIDDFWFSQNQTYDSKTLHAPMKLIYAGGIDKNKNIVATQQSMKILRDKGIKTELTVVGKIKDKSVYKAIEADEYTKCLPACGKENLSALYHEHDIFIMPSITETFGLVYAEALSCGLPVIYTCGQGFDRQFEEGIVGYHVNPHDQGNIAEVIEKIINRYHDIQRNTIEGSENFRWARIVRQYKNVYLAIIYGRNVVLI